MLYTGRQTAEISFPLGGIGTGCVGLGGNGRLRDWEIFGKPNKGSEFGFSHFAIKAERRGRVVDARVLIGDQPPPYSGQGTGSYAGFGFGLSRQSLQGVPHFAGHEFRGEFPFAEVSFTDGEFPGRVQLQAFNPFIPMNDRDSTIPAAFFTVTVKNTTKNTVRYTVAGTLRNPHSKNPVNRALRRGKARILHLTPAHLDPQLPEYSDLALATDAAETSHQEYWFRGAWFDNLGVYWQDFNRPGPLRNRTYPPPAAPDPANRDDHAMLAAHADVAPGATRTFRFVMAWNAPNMTNYWSPEKPACDCQGACPPKTWKHYYATLFKDAADSAAYALRHWDRLEAETRRFKDALFASSLPESVLDAVSANLSILKSPTALRLEDGSFYGFEGCHCQGGCCEGSCLHVWNYAYALPFLFPRLERSMHELSYRHATHDDGRIDFRLPLPAGRKPGGWHACADGQFGMAMRVYRDWKLSGDTAWLRSLWPALRRSIEFAWAETNEDRWDRDRDGVLEGRQHHTLDTELFGPNSYLTGFYLGALKAAAEMAQAVGEPETAAEFARLFEQGRTWCDKHLFNGDYYHQQVDVTDRKLLAPYLESDAKFGSIEGYYWDAEHAEVKYQLANGCHCDQVIAQWHANVSGLGRIFDARQTRRALASIHRHNFQANMRRTFNPCRIFAVNDEAALLIATYPKGEKPAIPMPYSEEAMHGFEYQAACHMIQEGLVEEGLAVVKSVRDRYDGEKRNPWNEIECGSNYARSMASYALVPALSGFTFDLRCGHIGFAPLGDPATFTCFWSVDGAWGLYRRTARGIRLEVLYGSLRLQSFSDSRIAGPPRVLCSVADAERAGDTIAFAGEGVELEAGETLRVGL